MYLKSLVLLGVCFSSFACSIPHIIADDYPQFVKDKGSYEYPTTKMAANYSFDKFTEEHRYEFRAITVGYAHLWIVEFGKMLDATLKSKRVQNSFAKLSKIRSVADRNGKMINFELVQYVFNEFRATVQMKISVMNDNKIVFSKEYKAIGDGQTGKMLLAGPFLMRNAVQKSTKGAIDIILTNFINDINEKRIAKNIK